MRSGVFHFGSPLGHKITKSVSLRGIGFLHFFTSLFEGRVETGLAPRPEPKYRNRVRGEPPWVSPPSNGEHMKRTSKLLQKLFVALYGRKGCMGRVDMHI